MIRLIIELDGLLADAVAKAVAKPTGALTDAASHAQAAAPKKAPKAEKAPEPEEDLGFEEKTEKPKELTQSDIIDAFRDYAEKNSREKAKAVLEKFKVKSVKDLKSEDYPKVLAILTK
jgi:hypothetical protein